MTIEDNIRNEIQVVFLEETRFARQAQCFKKIFQFKPGMFLKCFL